MTKKVAVLGSGSWGTALASLLADNDTKISLWGIDEAVCQAINDRNENPTFFPGTILPVSVTATLNLAEALSTADLVVLALPSHALSEVVSRALLAIETNVPIVNATKGLEGETFRRLSEVVIAAGAARSQVGVLSGPSFAKEVLNGVPTAVVLAFDQLEVARSVSSFFHKNHFRIYLSSDVCGVELGGAIKNVIAVAVGICDGSGLGSNARAAIITRGLSEMKRLVVALGGKEQTVAGLSGLGDLVLTSTSDLSRNRRAGLRLGRGEQLATILAEIGQVVEGVETAHKVFQLAKRHAIPMPITEVVHGVVSGAISPAQATKLLLERPMKLEED